jgi:hypothetical protein
MLWIYLLQIRHIDTDPRPLTKLALEPLMQSDEAFDAKSTPCTQFQVNINQTHNKDLETTAGVLKRNGAEPARCPSLWRATEHMKVYAEYE